MRPVYYWLLLIMTAIVAGAVAFGVTECDHRAHCERTEAVVVSVVECKAVPGSAIYASLKCTVRIETGPFSHEVVEFREWVVPGSRVSRCVDRTSWEVE